MLTQIARPYAAALFDLAKAEGALDAVESGLVDLQKLAGESEDFRRFLRSPVIAAETKAASIPSNTISLSMFLSRWIASTILSTSVAFM